MTEAVQILKGLQELGLKKAIATPHINHYYNNKPNELIRCYYDVVKEVMKHDLEISLGLAAEYMLDADFARHLQNGELLSLNDRFLLVELPHRQNWNQVTVFLNEIKLRGLRPVVAHPERHHYLSGSDQYYEKLRDAGCSFQLNMLSPLGIYGEDSARCAQNILKRDWYDFVGTDIHSTLQLGQLENCRFKTRFLNHIFL